MKRLQENNINTPEFFDKAYFGRERESQNDFNIYDDKRFEAMAKYFKGGKLLDLGAGDSSICHKLQDKFRTSEFHALDFASEVIRYLGEKYPKINYVYGEVLNTPYEDKYFDYIVAGELIEHMETPQNLVQEAMRILKPKGVLALSTPYKEEITIEKFISPEHIWSFDTEDIEDMLSPYGKVEIIVFKEEKHPKIIAWCKKYG